MTSERRSGLERRVQPIVWSNDADERRSGSDRRREPAPDSPAPATAGEAPLRDQIVRIVRDIVEATRASHSVDDRLLPAATYAERILAVVRATNATAPETPRGDDDNPADVPAPGRDGAVHPQHKEERHA